LATATPAIDIFVVVSLPTWPTTNTGQIRCLFMQPIRFELIIGRNMDTRMPQEQCAFVV
jgi:hypothetical protein